MTQHHDTWGNEENLIPDIDDDDYVMSRMPNLLYKFIYVIIYILHNTATSGYVVD